MLDRGRAARCRRRNRNLLGTTRKQMAIGHLVRSATQFTVRLLKICDDRWFSFSTMTCFIRSDLVILAISRDDSPLNADYQDVEEDKRLVALCRAFRRVDETFER